MCTPRSLCIALIAVCIFENVHAQIADKKIDQAAAFAFDTYKTIHQEPELGKKEFKTADLIRSKLRQFGYSDFVNISTLPTAVVAVLDSRRPGKTIGLRAELDARHGKENTGLPYSSKIDTLMHSCGHDAHAAILLATAKLLKENGTKLTGKIVFIFQPAEETKGGADDIVASGIIDQLGIQSLFALHVTDGLPVSVVRVSPGYIMAGSNYFTIELTGKSSHAAMPFEGSDLPLATAELVSILSNLPARALSISKRPCVVSTTYIQTGISSSSNVLPSTAVLKGTIRAYEDLDSTFDGQPSIKNIVESSIKTYCNSKGIQATITIEKGSPPTRNDVTLFDRIVPHLQSKFSGKVESPPFKSMTAEDFAYYTAEVPCLYFGLGIASDHLGYGSIHSGDFSIHPSSFKWGVELMTLLALE